MIRRIPSATLGGQPSPPLWRGTPAPHVQEGPSASHRARLAALLMDELTLAPARVVALAARELERFRGAAAVALHVHPDDFALFADAAELAREREIEQLTLIPDDTLTRGGCTIRSERGELDARIETRIERMLALLEGARP